MTQSFHLERCDPSRNMARFYRLELCQTLFGEVVLIRRWGRIGSAGRSREVIVSNGEAAFDFHAITRETLRRKIRRGYRLDKGQTHSLKQIDD